jgi:hypothetical protein
MNARKLVENAVISLGKEGITPGHKYGKIWFDTTQRPGGPWIYIKYMDKNCIFLRTFLYGQISQKLPKKKQFIPSDCMDCFKVVVRPESLDKLLELKDIMEELDFPGKCGIEKRESVDALYGGYFYCNGLDHGIERLAQVRAALKGTGMDPFLKRGCTEYEADFGPSDTWKMVRGQKAIENEAKGLIYIDNFKWSQRPQDKRNLMAEWEIFAEELGPVYKGTHNYVSYEKEKAHG